MPTNVLPTNYLDTLDAIEWDGTSALCTLHAGASSTPCALATLEQASPRITQMLRYLHAMRTEPESVTRLIKTWLPLVPEDPTEPVLFALTLRRFNDLKSISIRHDSDYIDCQQHRTTRAGRQEPSYVIRKNQLQANFPDILTHLSHTQALGLTPEQTADYIKRIYWKAPAAQTLPSLPDTLCGY